jgi:hypothetical protein
MSSYFLKEDKALILTINKFYISSQKNSIQDYGKDNSVMLLNKETSHQYKQITGA